MELSEVWWVGPGHPADHIVARILSPRCTLLEFRLQYMTFVSLRPAERPEKLCEKILVRLFTSSISGVDYRRVDPMVEYLKINSLCTSLLADTVYRCPFPLLLGHYYLW